MDTRIRKSDNGCKYIQVDYFKGRLIRRRMMESLLYEVCAAVQVCSYRKVDSTSEYSEVPKYERRKKTWAHNPVLASRRAHALCTCKNRRGWSYWQSTSSDFCSMRSELAPIQHS